MIVKTQILNLIAKSLVGSIPESGDQDLPMKSVLPIVQLCDPARLDGLIASGVIIRNSIIRTNYLIQTNAAGATSNIVNLGPGVWDVTVTSFHACNYSSVTAQPDGAIVVAAAAGAGISMPIHGYMCQGLAAACVTATLVTRFMLTIEDPLGYLFALQTQTNGVGQTQRLVGTVIANKQL